MALIEVMRDRPPAYSKCRGEGCGRLIEWVVTVANGRRMPVTAPLKPLRTYPRVDDGREVTVIEGEQSHFITCPGATKFREKKAGRTKRPKAVQQELFPS